jgi:hypothetical protein
MLIIDLPYCDCDCMVTGYHWFTLLWLIVWWLVISHRAITVGSSMMVSQHAVTVGSSMMVSHHTITVTVGSAWWLTIIDDPTVIVSARWLTIIDDPSVTVIAWWLTIIDDPTVTACINDGQSQCSHRRVINDGQSPCNHSRVVTGYHWFTLLWLYGDWLSLIYPTVTDCMVTGYNWWPYCDLLYMQSESQ